MSNTSQHQEGRAARPRPASDGGNSMRYVVGVMLVGLLLAAGCGGNAGSTSGGSSGDAGGSAQGSSDSPSTPEPAETPFPVETLRLALLTPADLPGEWEASSDDEDTDDTFDEGESGCRYIDDTVADADSQGGILGSATPIGEVSAEYAASLFGPFLSVGVAQFADGDQAEDVTQRFRRIGERCDEIRSENDDGTVTTFTTEELDVPGSGDRGGFTMSGSAGLFTATASGFAIRDDDVVMTFFWVGIGEELSRSFLDAVVDAGREKLQALREGTLIAPPSGGSSADSPASTPGAQPGAGGFVEAAFDDDLAIASSAAVIGDPCTDCVLRLSAPVLVGPNLEIPDSFFSYSADGTFVALPFSLENRGSGTIDLTNQFQPVPFSIVVEYPNGRQFSPSAFGSDFTDATVEMFGTVSSQVIRPGATGTGVLVFDLDTAVASGALVIVEDRYTIPLGIE